VRGFAAPGGADTPRRGLDRLTEVAREAGAKGLVWVAFDGEGSLEGIAADAVRSPAARFLTPEQWAAVGAACGASRGDLLLIVADSDAMTSRVLDVLRRQVAEDRALADPNHLAFCFITQFPMFEWNGEEQRWEAMHHLFTAPYAEDVPLLDSDPGKVRSHAYDLACNGQELGSGSIRIHQPELLLRVIQRLGMTEAEARQKFGHMLDAFTYGAPPHGGIAPGIDRTVAMLAGERDIREVIAFPKTKAAADPMTGAPSPVAERQLREVHIVINAEAQAALALREHGAAPGSE